MTADSAPCPGDGEIEEETVEHWSRYEFQLFDEKNGQADQHVR